MPNSKKPPRDHSLERAILSEPSRLPEGVDYCLARGWKKWSGWEQRFLEAVGRRHCSFDLVQAGVDWATQVRKSCWPDFEDALLEPDFVDYLVMYLAGVGATPTLMDRILAEGDPSLVTIFAIHAIRGPWPEAEAIILRSAKKNSSALLYDSVTKDECDYSTCVIEYALHSLQGRWHALEDKMGSGECTSWIMLQYADEVMKGRLPDLPHNTMVLRSFLTPDDADIRAYIAKYGV